MVAPPARPSPRLQTRPAWAACSTPGAMGAIPPIISTAGRGARKAIRCMGGWTLCVSVVHNCRHRPFGIFRLKSRRRNFYVRLSVMTRALSTFAAGTSSLHVSFDATKHHRGRHISVLLLRDVGPATHHDLQSTAGDLLCLVRISMG